MIETGIEIDDQRNTRYWKDYRLHRIDGPAVEFSNGDKCWYLNGKCHRIGGPARIYVNNITEFCENGLLHRIDGPAVIHFNGRKEWWIRGEEIKCRSQKKFIQIMKLKVFW